VSELKKIIIARDWEVEKQIKDLGRRKMHNSRRILHSKITDIFDFVLNLFVLKFYLKFNYKDSTTKRDER
jgi:hypothetical protein